MKGIFLAKLTVLFEQPFWVGVYERDDGAGYEICKITFGAEPKDYEVYAFLLNHWNELRFSQSVEAATILEKRVNPKRMQRAIKKQLQDAGIGTKAQQALKMQHEQKKLEQKNVSGELRELEKERQFELRQKKRKAKNKGR